MRVLILGSNGQVGAELHGALQSELSSAHLEFEILCLTRADLDLAKTSFIYNFLVNKAPDVVVNASAYTAVDKAESEAKLAFMINEHAVGEIAKYCSDFGSKMIHISTDYVFDGAAKQPYGEEEDVSPSGVYGQSKLAGENLIRRTLTEHLVLRTSWVFGASGNNFVKTMLAIAQERKELGVVADQFGAPTSARAIAGVIAKTVAYACKSDQTEMEWGTYHYSGFPYVSWAEFASEIFEQATLKGIIPSAPVIKSISSEAYPTPAKRPANSRLDCSKLKATFGIDPDDWKTSLGLVLDDLKEGMRL